MLAYYNTVSNHLTCHKEETNEDNFKGVFAQLFFAPSKSLLYVL